MSLHSLGIGQYYTPNKPPDLSKKKWPPHSHSLWEFTLNTHGSGETRIGDKVYPFTEGTIVCIPPGMPHCRWCDYGFNDFYFHTDTFLTVDRKPFSTDRPIILQDDCDGSIQTLFSLLFKLYYRKRPEERAVVHTLFESLLQLIVVRIGIQQTDPLEGLVDQVKSSIILSFTNPEINLSEILSSSHYSENYMRKKFKDVTGMTPLEYLTKLRIDYALQLLSQKKRLNLSVSEVARMCGFHDVHYFCRIFRAKTRLSPRAYISHGNLPIDEKAEEADRELQLLSLLQKE